GVNIGLFTKDFNERTKADMGLMIPVVITVYSDRSFTFVCKTPPAALLIKKACGIDTASGVPQRDKVATISMEDVRKIAEQKMPDLNCTDIESAISMIKGTCRSMGVVVGE
ncbi:MAG: 50S ribosomal protein L11, partial [Oscillospiraceae bacterium]|nr:50S ribosomal protein L11 [Oscillospiraceae bacterium]